MKTISITKNYVFFSKVGDSGKWFIRIESSIDDYKRGMWIIGSEDMFGVKIDNPIKDKILIDDLEAQYQARYDKLTDYNGSESDAIKNSPSNGW